MTARLVPSTLSLLDVLRELGASLVFDPAFTTIRWNGHTIRVATAPFDNATIDWLESLGAIRLLTTEEMRELGAVLEGIGK